MSNDVLTLTATVDTRQYTSGAETIGKANEQIESSTASAANTMNKSTGQAGDSVENVAGKSEKSTSRIAAAFGAVAGVAQSVVTKAFNMVTDSIGGAVSRVDTLNNFPKVMTNLGYSADESSRSIQSMADHLSGLPTTLNGLASVTQRLAPVSPTLTDATNTALAFNDALLAGGNSADIQSNAMDQLVQMLSSGKVDMDAWTSVNEAMPGQMQQVAKSILGTSASTNDLYKAMQDGKVSTQQFADAFVKLDKDGANGMASFSQQARDATGGIQTGWANMKNAIVKGLADIINSIGASNISGVITAIGTVFKTSLDIIAAAIKPVMQLISQVVDWVTKFAKAVSQTSGFKAFTDAVVGIGKSLGGILQTIGQVVSGMFDFGKGSDSAQGSAQIFGNVLQGVSDVLNAAGKVIQNVSQWISDNSGLVQTALSALGGAFAAFKIGSFVQDLTGAGGAISKFAKGLSDIPGLLSKASGGIGNFIKIFTANPIMTVVVAVAALAAGLVYFFTKTETGRKIWGEFTEWLKNTWDSVSQFFSTLWDGITKVFSNAADAVKNAWNGVSDWFKNIWDGLSGAASNAWNGVTRVVSNAVKTVQDILKNSVAVIGAIPVWIGQQLLNGINVIFSSITGVLQGWFQNSTGFVHTALGGILTIVSNVWNSLYNIVSVAVNLVRTIVVTVMDLISGDWQGAWDTISSFFQSVWDLITQTFQNIVDRFTNIFNTFVGAVSNVWNTVWTAIKDFFTTIWNGIVAFFSPILSAIQNAINNALNAIKNVWNSIWTAVSDFIRPIWNAISTTVGNAINAVKGVISNVLNAIQTVWNNVWNAVSKFVGGIWNGIVNAVSNGISRVSGVVGRIKDTVLGAVSGAGQWLYDTGRQIINGLGNGIVNGFKWLRDRISEMGSNIVSWAKRVLKVGSPSKVMGDEIGRWLPAGVAVGFDKGMPDLQRDVTAKLDGLVRTTQMSDIIKNPMPFTPNVPMTSGYTVPTSQSNFTNRNTVNAPITVQTNDPMAAGMEAARIINFHYV
ncbi:MAG: hypothetical protein [Bacteriophage sp.]|nr:MAG: hypothetical protein [Bacteriophage sp.]